MNFPEGILLGLSTGVVCLAYCGPVIIPYLLGENKNISKNFFIILLFLSGRFVSYMIFGLIAGISGKILIHPSMLTNLIVGISYIILSLLLIIYGFYQFKEICLAKIKPGTSGGFFNKRPYFIPFYGGLISGLNICPPFLIAVTKAITTNNITDSLVFFFMFFIGTSIFFIPLPFLGIFKRQQVLRIIGKFAAILAGLIYLFKGVLITFN